MKIRKGPYTGAFVFEEREGERLPLYFKMGISLDLLGKTYVSNEVDL